MTRKAITANNLPSAGPYSHAVESGGLVFLSGQTPFDPATGKLVEGDIEKQTIQCFNNLKTVLKEAGLTLENVIKVNVFLTDMNDFSAMNEIYKTMFSSPYPARSTVEVSALPLGAKIEIELIAEKRK